jgi:hypothetical protein
MSFAATTNLKQLGENDHCEYGWTDIAKDRIVQFHFQCTRTDDLGVFRLRMFLNKLLVELKNNLSVFNIERNEAEKLLSILYKMIGFTRDIIDGKGECTLTYMMIREWYNFYPNLALFALDCLVKIDDKNTHPYGSWKDIKYFCKYCREQGDSFQNPLLRHCIFLLNDQLRKDYTTENPVDISLVSKWIPREKSSFGWMYEAMATHYFSSYMEFCKNDDSKKRAILKCKTQYRTILATLNKRIDTLQIKQCNKNWANIDFNKVTSISMAKQRKAFLNVDIKDNRKVRFAYDTDRVQCAENYNEHIEKSVRSGVEVKGKRVSMASFTKEATQIINNLYFHDNDDEITKIEKNALNSQWRDNSSQTRCLGKMVAMVDVSGSMDGDPVNVAIALGIRIAENSLLGKRVMTFSSTPEWVDLEQCDDFVDCVGILKRSNWGMNTNFYAALDMILEEIRGKNLSKTEVEDMVLVILSDMQIDKGDNSDKVMYEVMQSKYAEAGMRICGEPYSPPHILFWNLKNLGGGFPCLSSEPNISMMSGFSPALLNMFCQEGMEALKDSTPFNMLEKSLNGERYKILNDKFFMEI